jgi:phospholipid/cholesterol/gamma-HCH transport system substrate-binding protein
MGISTEMSRGARDITLASRIFLVAAALSLIAAAVLLAYNQGAFTSTVRVYFYAGTADGMNKGMAVKLVGFNVGSVGSIAIEPDLRVKVELKIVEKYAPMIYSNAVIRLTREAVIGGNILEIRPGTGNVGPIADRSVLRFERDPGIEGAITKLLDQLAPIVSDVRQITTFLNNPEGDFRQAMRNLNLTATRLGEASAGLRQLTTAAVASLESGGARAGTMMDSTEFLVKDARAALGVLDGSLRKIDAALPGIASKVDQSLENIRATSEAVRGMVTGGGLPGLVGEAGGLVSDTSEVVRGVKRAWPLRDLLQPPRESLLRLDGGGGLTAVPVEGARDR